MLCCVKENKIILEQINHQAGKMNTENEIQSLQRIVEKDFVDSRFRTLIPNNDFEKLEEFRNYLIVKLKDMYEHNYELLLNTLYRIDVSENKLSELFSGQNRDDIPGRLAI